MMPPLGETCARPTSQVAIAQACYSTTSGGRYRVAVTFFTAVISALFFRGGSCLGGLPEANAHVVWPSVIHRVERGLSSGDSEVRREASKRLLELPPGPADELVKRALADSDAEVRRQAALAATSFRIAGSGRLVVGWLTDPDPRAREAACKVLQMDPVAEASGTLGRVLGDASRDVRVAAADALANSFDRDAAIVLLGHLDDVDTEVRVHVLRALGKLRDARSVIPLLGRTSDPEASALVELYRTLGKLRDPRSLSAILLALKHRDEGVRVSAVEALGALGDASTVPALAAFLADYPRQSEQEAALEALAEIGGVESARVALDMLRSEHPEANHSAASAALKSMGSDAVDQIRRAVESSADATAADRSLRVWSHIEPFAAAQAARRLLGGGAVSQATALDVLGAAGLRRFLPDVLARLSHDDPEVRKVAREASRNLLEGTGPESAAVDAIAEALKTYGSDLNAVREHLTLLGLTGAARASVHLLAYARDENPKAVRILAIQALGRLAPGPHDAALLKWVQDNDPEVAGEAALALRTAGRPELLPELFRRFDASGSTLRRSWLTALFGSMSRASDPKWVEAGVKRFLVSGGAERDLWLEALGAARSSAASRELGRRLSQLGPDDRRKMGESFYGKQHLGLLRRLASDSDARVRGQAVWSLGWAGDANDVTRVMALANDGDLDVAINAASALARLAGAQPGLGAAICKLLQHAHPYVRVNGLAARALVSSHCMPRVRELMERDPSEIVRRAAAQVLWETAEPEDIARLSRCAAEDAHLAVRAACRKRAAQRSDRRGQPSTVLVVSGKNKRPEPLTGYACHIEQGMIRAGTTDRRGAFFEAHPGGRLELLVPAHLAW